ncbi:MAG TPA: hypothetical protein VH062_35320 [Polyangiaceae bacterium]|jgi:hypothetical protein|nr:hypothetical protein [Polyangiaceae bacterium]
MRLRSLMIGVAVAVLASPAIAQERRPFRLFYAASPGCPAGYTLSSSIEAHSASIRAARPGETAIDVDASVGPDGGAFLGLLRIQRPDGTETRRTVPAASCVEVVSAMAFIAAVAIDPGATLATPADRAESTRPALLDGPPAAALPVTVAAGAAPNAESVVPTRTPSPAPRAGKLDSRSWWFAASTGVGLASAIAPGFSPDFGIGIAAGAPRRGMLSPLVHLSGHFAESRELSGGGGTAQFRRVAGRVTACPVAASAAMVVLRPCALLDVGQLRATGSNVAPALTARTLWLELGATVRAEARITGPLFVMAELGAGFPLVRDDFYFVPSRVPVHTIPPVGFIGALELGVRI